MPDQDEYQAAVEKELGRKVGEDEEAALWKCYEREIDPGEAASHLEVLRLL